jgi:hypothetical protein
MRKIFFIIMAALSVSAHAQNAKVLLNTETQYFSGFIKAYDSYNVYILDRVIKYDQIDTIKFDQAPDIKFLTQLHLRDIPFFINDNIYAYTEAEELEAISQYDAENQANFKSASKKSSKGASNIFKGMGAMISSLGLTLHFRQIDDTNQPTLDEYNSQTSLANGLIITGGVFMMVGHFIEPE